MVNDKKDFEIETLRGLAILLVLALHLSVEREFDQIRDSLDYISFIFSNIRIPLFTVISGYFFTYLSSNLINDRKFVIKKFRRIIVPLYVVLTLELVSLYIISLVRGETLSYSFYEIYIKSYSHYWFLQAIFIIFISYFFIIKFFESYNFANLFFFIVSSALYLLLPKLDLDLKVFSIGGVFYLFPYFILGASFLFLSSSKWRRLFFIIAIFVFSVLLVYQVQVYNTSAEYLFSKRTLFGFLIGLSSCYLLLSTPININILSFIGGYSFSIYLYQSFGSKVSKIIAFDWLDLKGYPAFILLIIGTVVFGIVLDILLSKWNITRIFFLGKNRSEKSVEVPTTK